MIVQNEKIQIKILSGILQVVNNFRLYGGKHAVSEKSLLEFKDSIEETLKEQSEFSLSFRGWHVYLCGERIKISTTSFPLIRQLVELFQTKNFGGIRITKSVSVDELSIFIDLLSKDDLTGDTITKKLLEKGIDTIRLLPIIAQPTEILDPKKRVKQIYFETINLVKSLAAQKSFQKSNFTKFSVGVLYLIDTLKTSESLLLGLTVVKNYDDFLYNHSVNTAVLSLSLGVRIGLKSKELLKLGQAALLHDIGMINIPREILKKETLLTEDEWEMIKTHPVNGVKITIDLMGLSEDSSQILLAILEHQKSYDGSGYPEYIKNSKLSLFARIIQIADFYDAVTTPKFHNPVPMSPAEAIAYLVRHSGKLFDPLLSKHFINLLGIYPLGTLVFLTSGEWALVVGQPQDPDKLHKPVVLIIKDAEGKDVPHKLVDLSQSEVEIVKADSPWKFGIDPAEYLI
ncbi:MAG: HD domain-containing phosphohydrolase [candidate division WOR-3 bacterium]